jgi:predicted ATPase
VEQGAYPEGVAQLRQGLNTWRTMEGAMGVPSFLAMLATAYARGGQIEAGLGVLTEALETAHHNAEHYYEPELHRLTGELLLQEGKTPHSVQAEEHFQRAIDLAQQQHARSLELRAVLSWCRLKRLQGYDDVACRRLAATYGWFTEGWHTPDGQEAQALLTVLQCPSDTASTANRTADQTATSHPQV